MKTVKELKKGDLFRVKNSTYIRGAFCRENNKYSCTNYDDINNERFFPGNKLVDINFTF